MDFLESIGKQLSEVTMYDVKSTFDKAKAMVMNYTEMEAKVHEATNNDPWGASSTLMQEIASATHSFELFNQTMPVIYKRFTEKEARDWRQIYKALQLLEYLVKHGSERVVDDARSHLSMIKMLRNFHYVDDKGKDQGINVRNRSKELAELLSDLDRVRQERRKAKSNRNKYSGVGSDGTGGGGGSGGASPSFTSTSGSRYGGFGSDSFNNAGSSSSSAYPDSSYPSSSTRNSNRRESFDEYDAGDDDDRTASTSAPPQRRSNAPAPIKKDTPVIPQQKMKKEVNLFDFDDDEPLGGGAPAAMNAPAHAAAAAAPSRVSFDDDFDDFQAAPSVPKAAPVSAASRLATVPASGSSNFFDMMGSGGGVQAQAQPQMRTSQHMPAGPTYNVGMFANNNTSDGNPRPGMAQSSSFSSLAPTQARPSSISPAPMSSASSSSTVPMQAKKPAGGAVAFDFDDLFAANGAKGSSGSGTGASGGRAGVAAAGQNSMASLQAQKGSQQIWGNMGGSNGAGQSSGGNGFDDLLF